jgi:hypothetical protein
MGTTSSWHNSVIWGSQAYYRHTEGVQEKCVFSRRFIRLYFYKIVEFCEIKSNADPKYMLSSLQTPEYAPLTCPNFVRQTAKFPQQKFHLFLFLEFTFFPAPTFGLPPALPLSPLKIPGKKSSSIRSLSFFLLFSVRALTYSF